MEYCRLAETRVCREPDSGWEGGDSRDSLGASGLAKALRILEGWGSEAGELDSFQAVGGPVTLRGLTSGSGGLSPCRETRDQGLEDLRLQSARKIRARVGGGVPEGPATGRNWGQPSEAADKDA